jgi:hypothetical protein
MNNKEIPTTKEHFKEFFDSFPRYGASLAKGWEKEIIKLSNAQTKLHVEAALKAAKKDWCKHLINKYTDEAVNTIEESILNSYPLTNIT